MGLERRWWLRFGGGQVVAAAPVEGLVVLASKGESAMARGEKGKRDVCVIMFT